MSAEAERFKERTERFALDVFALLRMLPSGEPGPTIRKQLSKSATSIGANYRAACRARSHAEFTSRIALVAEEADETLFWLGIILKAGFAPPDRMRMLLGEARELVAVFSAALGTARRHERLRPKG